jgi:hypothetical protein
MNQSKLDDFGEVVETIVSNIPEIIKAVKKAYEGMLMEIGRDDCNIVYAGGCLREAKWVSGRNEGANYSELNESVAYCGEISSRIYDFVKKEFGDRACVTIEGHFMGEGAKHSTDQHGDHLWVVLADGTIVDGAYKQYQDPSLKRRKRIRFVKPTDPEYADYGFSATSINSNYGADYNPKGRVKIPIDNAKVSNKVWEQKFQHGKKVWFVEHSKDGDSGRYICDYYIDPVREHKRCTDIRDRLQREKLLLDQMRWIDGIKNVYPKRDK